VSYSQYDEEKYILECCPDEGSFLDIGAWDGKTFSNTLALAERGWGGILVEPSPESFIALLKLHGGNPRMTLIHAAVGFERCMVRLWNSADAVSTTQEASYEAWKAHAEFTGSFYVPMITIEDIWNQFGGADFINIDTEGTSVDLALHLFQTLARPRCLCIEHDGRLVELQQAAQGAGYKTIHTNGTNVVLSL